MHSQVSLPAYELHESGVRNSFRRGTVPTCTYCTSIYMYIFYAKSAYAGSLVGTYAGKQIHILLGNQTTY